MLKYVTYLTTYTGDKLPKFYVGSTFQNKILKGSYFGSIKSKKWKDIFNSELKDNQYLFSVKILSCHKTRKAALKEELRIQILNNVIKSTKYFNESLARPNGFFGRDVRGENNPFFEKKHSPESKKKQSESKIGKITWMKGKNHIDSSKIKNANNHKSKYRNFSKLLNGKVIGKWKYPFELKRDNPKFAYTNIIKCCKGQISQAYGFVWIVEQIKNKQ